jgi:hypothetical protein
MSNLCVELPVMHIRCYLKGIIMKHRRKVVSLLSFLVIGLAGAGQSLAAGTDCSAKKKDVAGFGSKFLTLKDFWDYKDGTANHVANNFNDTYTRLIVLNGKNTNKDVFGYSSPWWPRLIRNANRSANISAKIAVGNFETTVPLATLSHDDGSGGEYWTKSIHYDQQNFPLFLLPADGSAAIPAITLTMTLSEEIKSRGASRGLEAALAFARATNPAAGVITRLSEQATKERARALDDVISSLFSNGIKEEHSTDRDLRLLHTSGADCDDKNSPTGLTVEFVMPENEGKWAEDKKISAGTWTITFDYPHLSIFSDWRICDTGVTLAKCAGTYDAAKAEIARAVVPSNVLSYRLTSTPGNQMSIKTYLNQQDWYIAATNELAGSDAEALKLKNSRNLCRRIESEITALGLSSLDAQIVVWAVINGMPLPPNAPDFSKETACSTFADYQAKVLNGRVSTADTRL